MKTLLLCVDRDDDVGQKAGITTPIVGRRANIEAATRLGIADPEDSDTNAIFAAVHLHDKHVDDARPQDHYEVATITGHHRMGIRGDRKLADELDDVLQQVRPDEVVLVSDGAEDERILPIIQSRVRVAHVHRSVVKQAPRLEGFYYVLARMLDDRKQALRFVLPTGIILAVWGVATLTGLQEYALGTTLALAGFWLIIHAMKWEDAFGRIFHDLGQGMKSGKMTILFNVAALAVLGFGAATLYNNWPHGFGGWLLALIIVHGALPWITTSLIIYGAGRLFDAWVREGRAGIRIWSRAVNLIAAFFVINPLLGVSIDYLAGEGLGRLTDLDVISSIFIGVLIAGAGLILTRYLRAFFLAPTPR